MTTSPTLNPSVPERYTISEYNEGYYGSFTDGDGLYDTRTVPTGDFEYIHVKDLSGGGGAPPPDGSFVSYDGSVYRIAGGAPLYIAPGDAAEIPGWGTDPVTVLDQDNSTPFLSTQAMEPSSATLILGRSSRWPEALRFTSRRVTQIKFQVMDRAQSLRNQAGSSATTCTCAPTLLMEPSSATLTLGRSSRWLEARRFTSPPVTPHRSQGGEANRLSQPQAGSWSYRAPAPLPC